MKCLIYCIYQKGAGGTEARPLGVDGRPVSVVEKDDIVAAVSRVALPGDSADIAAITNYHRVIDHLHCHRTVIPVRFGTLLDNEIEVENFLQKRGSRYKELLLELQGRVEMGIRVILADQRQSTETLPRSEQFRSSEPLSPGVSYLAGRKAHYAMASLLAEDNEKVISAYSASFKGLYSKVKSEISGTGINDNELVQSTLLSLYFLVPRESLADFRRAFADLKARESARLLLSGPWPPYNFVLPSDFPTQGSGGTRP